MTSSSPANRRRVFQTLNTATGWGALNQLPEWVEALRPHQYRAIEETVDSFRRSDVVVVDAPTGSGKSLIAECVRRLMGMQAVYVTHSKSLQDQLARDFDYAAVLKGRSNYPTHDFPELFTGMSHLSAADCNKSDSDGRACSWCGDVQLCPYERAKRRALGSDLCVLNTRYWLTESNGPGKFSKSGLVVLDECDTLEEELMGYVEARVSPSRIKKHQLGSPDRVTKPEAWTAWIDSACPVLRQAEQQTYGDSVHSVRERLVLHRLHGQLQTVRKGLGTEDWVYTGNGGEVAFRPTRVNQMGRRIWKHADKFLLMSATVISSSQLLKEIGYEDHHETVVVPSTFPVANRKVVVTPVIDNTYNASEEELEKLTGHVASIIARHPGERVLVHSVSYNLGRAIEEGLRSDVGYQRPVYRHQSAADKQRSIDDWQGTEAGVLISPSMDRGVDLPGDACRAQIIVKCPFPNLGDKQVSKRLYSEGGQLWYAVKTIRAIVQMTGRIVRSEEDWGTTYILDRGFIKLWKKWKMLFPEWWRDSLVW